MKKNEPNKIVNALYKRFLAHYNQDASDTNYTAGNQISKELADITRVVGAIEVMSKNNIIKLVRMQSAMRFMPHHSFYIEFSRACDSINKVG